MARQFSKKVGKSVNISKYQVFVKVVELGNLTRAAERMGYTQSAISHIINSLEEEFGFRLLQRGRSGVFLTSDGERVLPLIRAILNDSERLNQVAASIRGLDAGVVRVATFTSVGVHWLPGMIKSFQKKYPNIEFNLLNGDYYDLEHWLTDGSADIGFITLPTDGDFTCIPLYRDRILAILPEDHPFSDLSYLPLEKLQDEPFISLPENSGHDVRRALQGTGVRPNVKFYTKDDYAIISMVSSGLGIGIMPELMLSGYRGQLCIKELENQPYRTICLALPQGASQSPATDRFAQHVQSWVQENVQQK